ncbi:universal stress protein [Natrarchaeobius chitinivorans]|uniref:Universal stress protein n=1 Tax=Natrarchaeobius chitinivorans TaxID=1679083 RepID=A0A3N6MFG3_NATCH|nr:universal stress protein [Natrarchaeobius chitinivorans]RQG95470.1 universal stress protein [Natrarchaeobius chitinivorans]
MADRVLVAYDATPLADDALEFAFERFPDAELTALYVVEIPDSHWAILEGPEIRLPITERAHDHATEVLEGAVELAAEYDRGLTTEIETGKPDQRIVDLAADEGYDAIVLGSHGRSRVSSALLGSVAERVVRQSPVPVAVVR